MPKIYLIYVPLPDEFVAKKIATKAIQKSLAACVQFIPTTSNYLWENKIESAQEIITIFKTTKPLKSKLQNYIRKKHPYDVPCIICIKAKVNKKYYSWMMKK